MKKLHHHTYAIGLIYLENLIGEDQFRLLIQEIVNIKSNKELYEIFNENYDFDLDGFWKIT